MRPVTAPVRRVGEAVVPVSATERVESGECLEYRDEVIGAGHGVPPGAVVKRRLLEFVVPVRRRSVRLSS